MYGCNERQLGHDGMSRRILVFYVTLHVHFDHDKMSKIFIKFWNGKMVEFL